MASHTNYGLLKAIRSHIVDSPSVATELKTGRPNACNLCHLDRPLGWAAQNLKDWYGLRTPAELSNDHKEVAYGIERLTRGDAGQRALIGWSMGWEPAQVTSGAHWMAPYLGLLLNDPYVAVRYIGGRSLRSLPGFADFEYDFLATPEELNAAPNAVVGKWGRALQESRRERRALHIDIPILKRLLSERDNTPVYLNE